MTKKQEIAALENVIKNKFGNIKPEFIQAAKAKLESINKRKEHDKKMFELKKKVDGFKAYRKQRLRDIGGGYINPFDLRNRNLTKEIAEEYFRKTNNIQD